MKQLAFVLAVFLLLVGADDYNVRRNAKANARAVAMHHEQELLRVRRLAHDNDDAARECSCKTGYKWNREDGTQSADTCPE
jgi:hypothetical protein